MNETIPNPETDVLRLEAQKRAKKIRKFYRNLTSWASTSFILIAIDIFTSHGLTWSRYPVFFWGIAIAFEFFAIIKMQHMDGDWEEKILRKHSRQTLPDPDKGKSEDYSEELLRQTEEPIKEKADLTEYRKLKRPWKDEDLV